MIQIINPIIEMMLSLENKSEDVIVKKKKNIDIENNMEFQTLLDESIDKLKAVSTNTSGGSV